MIKIALKSLFLSQNHKNRPAAGGSATPGPTVICLSCISLFSKGPKQARSQKFKIGALPEIRNGGAVLGVWGRSPQRSKILRFFFQKQRNFRARLIKNNAFKTWHRNWQRNIIQLVALMGYVGSG